MNTAPLAVSGPLFFLLAPLALAALAYLLHRWSVASGLVATVGSLGLGWFACAWLLDLPISWFGRELILTPEFVFLGRSWALTPASAALIALQFLAGGLCFLLSLPASQGWAFHPFGLAMLGILSMSATAEQFIYVVLFFWLGVISTGFVLAGGRPGMTMGALRLVVINTLAVMPLLLLPTFLGIEPVQTPAGIVLGILGLSMLLMLPPFHGALIGAAASGAPMPAVMVLTILPTTALYILFRLGQIYPMVLEDGLFFDICQWLGLGAVILGGLVAPAQRRWGTLIGYATLIDWGIGLMAVGQGTPDKMMLAAQMALTRMPALLLCGAGLVPLFEAAGKRDDLDRCTGMLFYRPLNVISLLLGLLLLAGLPVPTGMVGRWTLLAELIQAHPVQVWIVVAAGLGVAVGAVVGLLSCLGQAEAGMVARRRDEMIALAFGLLALWIAGVLLSAGSVWQPLLEKTLKVLIDL